jgi:hypothetical protein
MASHFEVQEILEAAVAGIPKARWQRLEERQHLVVPSGRPGAKAAQGPWSLFFPANREIFKKNREAIEHERAITERD